MKNIIHYSLLLLTLLVACSSNPVVNIAPSISNQSEMKIKLKVEDILKNCATKLSPGESIYNNDTISFVIYQDGFAKNGIEYRSLYAISKPWASCIENLIISTDFSPVGGSGEYTFHYLVDWDSILIQHPELLTPKAKVKGAMQNNAPQFKSCYNSYLDNGGKEQGRVNIKFDILPEGKARNIDVSSEDLKDKNLLMCVNFVVSKIQFPKTSDSIKIIYPAIFKQ